MRIISCQKYKETINTNAVKNQTVQLDSSPILLPVSYSPHPPFFSFPC